MISVDSLIAPVSDDNPVGEDLAASGALFELESLVVGKPETQFSEAEEPDWREVEERCSALLERSKDLRVAVILAGTLLKTGGFPGLRDGLALVRQLHERYWDSFYPQLDPDDNNDPQERVNVLNNLAAPIGTFGDPLKVLDTLRRSPITRSREAGNWGLGAILASRDASAGEGEDPPPAASLVDGAFRETPRENLEGIQQAVTEAIEQLEAIDAHYTQTIVAPISPSLENLIGELRRVLHVVAPYLNEGSGETGDAGAAAAGADDPAGTGFAPTGAGGGRGLSGGIGSREDVVKALDLVIAYYRRHEPSSPIPFLLERVKRLVPMSFMELIRDLTPEAMEKFLLLTGSQDESM
jgi:type VI secretion system protein ImpA